jgi:hypothetical protein
MVWVQTGRVDVVKVAFPFESGDVPNTFAPLRNVTDPVGNAVPIPGNAGATKVVSVTELLRFWVAEDTASVVEVAALFDIAMFRPEYPNMKNIAPVEYTTASKR